MILSRAGAPAELELYPVQVKLLRYQLSGQRQPNANMFAGMVGSIGGMMSSKHRQTSSQCFFVSYVIVVVSLGSQLPISVVVLA